MKRTSLTTAVIAGLAGVAGIANMAGAVNLSSDGTGSVLIYPYYTVNSNNVTLLSVVNTTGEGKAIKVRFLEAYNSREVLDFNLYMSPYDVWTAEVDPVGAGAGVTTSDNSCTVPGFVGQTVPFVNYAYAGACSDTGPTGLARTTEGYVEMIEMGTVNDNTSGSLSAITHDNTGVPASCAQVVNAWGLAGSAANYWSADPTVDIGPADGGLFGSGTVVNVGQGTVEGYNADALEGFYAAGGFDHQAPGTVKPDLNDAAAGLVAYTINTSGAGTAPSVATTTFTRPVDAVSAVFMTDNIYNEFVVNSAYGQSTEWVVTFPTKRFYVDPAAFVTALDPFDEVFGETIDGYSCTPVSISYYDREEGPRNPPPSIGFSPPLPGTDPNVPVLCWETNIVTFNQSGDQSTVLGSNRVANIDIKPDSITAGWVNLSFDDQNGNGYHNLVGTGAAGDNVFQGLPATGFSVQQTINANAAPGMLANYTALYNHKYNRVCASTAGGPCS
jgi:hypothetical protein